MFRMVILFGVALVSTGCAVRNPTPTAFQVSAGGYADAFDAARNTLLAMQFELDRIDARAGVITTRPKHSAGIAAPWDTVQSTLWQEWEDFTHDQSRSVRVLFEPAERTPATAHRSPGSALMDLRTYSGEITGTVIIVIERKVRPNWRIDTTSIRLSSFAFDPLGGGGRVLVPIERDPRLEGRLARRIERRMTKSP